MKYLSGMAMAAVMMLSLASCSSEELSNGSASSSSKALSQVPLEITVNNEGSRSIIEGTTLPEECSYKIYPYLKDGDWKKLTNDDHGTSVKYSKGESRIDGMVYLPEDGSDVSVVAIYGTEDGGYVDQGVLEVGFAVPEQIDYLVGHNVNTVNKDNPKAQICFQHIMSRVTIHVTKSEDNKNSYKFSDIKVNNLFDDGYINVSPEGEIGLVGLGMDSNNITVKTAGNYLLENASDTVDFDFLVMPTEQELGITLQGSTTLKTTLPKTNFEMGQQYTFNVVIGKSGPTVIDDHEAVDLGLPSGLKWATCNVDLSQPNKAATAPEAYGGYYGWADPTGNNASTNDDDYPNATPEQNIQNTDYDIAHVNWGKGWRLPTDDEQQELVDKCTWTKETVNGVNCYRVTGPNGNSIILPLAGIYFYSSVNGISSLLEQDNVGFYMSGQSFFSNTDNKYHIHIIQTENSSSGNGFVGWVTNRANHISVRPVTDQ